MPGKSGKISVSIDHLFMRQAAGAGSTEGKNIFPNQPRSTVTKKLTT